MTFLVDTGAQRSFISRKQYEEKLERHTPYKDTNVRMYGMGGAEMNIKGQIEVPVHVGEEMLYHNFLIADIEEEAIMGFDFMKKHKVEWTWADQTLQICQSKIPCDMDPESTPRRVARISTRTSMIIPPRSEVIISRNSSQETQWNHHRHCQATTAVSGETWSRNSHRLRGAAKQQRAHQNHQCK